MSEKIVVPVLGESITEATVSKWLKNEGDTVDVDEPIVELETDKVNLEVPSPVSGILSEINSKDGAVVEVGALLGSVSEDGSGTIKEKEIKKIEPKLNENNIVNLEASKKEPKIFEENLEFLWRLRFDTRRRVKRLIINSFFLIYGIIFKKFNLELEKF